MEIEAKLNLDDSEYQRKIDEINRKRKIELEMNTSSRGYIDSSKEKSINFKYDNQIGALGLQMEKNISKANYELEKIADNLKNNESEQDKLNSKINVMQKKYAEASGMFDSSDKIENTNNSLLKTIKHVGRLALAVFGLRSLYGAVSRAAGILSSYNEQIGTDLEYIKFALASTLQPIIETLISLVLKFLSYVNYLAKAWFGVNLFAKATTDNFNKSNKSAKNLKKTLGTFGFDELNILQDNSGDDSDSQIKTPSMDLSSIEDIEPPKWLEVIKDIGQWIIDHWKEIALAIGLVGAALLGIKIFKWIKGAKDATKATEGLGNTFKGFFDGLGKGLEALGVLGGLALVIESVCDLIDTFANSGLSLNEILGLMAIVLGSIVIAFGLLLGAMTLMDPSWQSIAAAAVIFGGLFLVLESVTKLIDTFAKSGLSLTDVLGLMGTVLGTIVGLMGAIVLLGPGMTAGLIPFLVVVGGISALLIVMAETLPIILEASAKFIKEIGPVIIEILKTIGNVIKEIILALGTTLPPIINSIGSLFEKIFNGIAKVIETVGNTIINIMNTAGGLIKTVLQAIVDFINQLGPAINNFVDNAISAVTKLINFLVSGIEYMINTLIIDAINGLISAVNNIPLVDIPEIPRVSIARFQPVLMAGGGIIDVPKRGVPLANNVIGGEAGAEGVLPLENEDTMERLGREIGRWITLNIDLTGKIDMRILFKEFIKYYNEQKFSKNGGGF